MGGPCPFPPRLRDAMNALASSPVSFPSPFVSATGNRCSNFWSCDSDCEKTTGDMKKTQVHRWIIFMSRRLLGMELVALIALTENIPNKYWGFIVKGRQKANEHSSSTDLTKNELLRTLGPLHVAQLVYLNPVQFDRMPWGQRNRHGRSRTPEGCPEGIRGEGRAFRQKLLRTLPRQPG